MKFIGVEIAPEHSFGRQFLEGVAGYATTRRDWRLCSLSLDGITKSAICNLDGLILRVFRDRVARTAKELKIPLVDIYGSKPRHGIAQIHGDYAALGRIAAEFFISRGFIHYGWCGIDGLVFSDETRDCFLEILATHEQKLSVYKCPPHLKESIVYTIPDQVPDSETIRIWLETLPKPCAIFCCNDHRAYQVMRVALEAGFTIPQDFAILGVDNDTMICSYAQVPLSSIDPNATRIGFSAARLLNALIEREPADKIHRVTLIPPKGIAERRSTEHIPVDPPWLSNALLTIERNLETGVSASDIYRIADLSAPSVERIFHKKLGSSVIAYITNARMKKAKCLLQSTNLLTKQIAAACGYTSSQYFCRVFQTHYGISPQTLRQRK